MSDTPQQPSTHGRPATMRVHFVGHATLFLELGAIKVLTDPWWSGPAYRGQWYPYPAPVPERFDLQALDAIYISHGHEDHLHRETLTEILDAAPDVQAIIPRRYDTGLPDYLRRIGFRSIREVPSGTSVQLRNGADVARLRVFTHLDDSLLGVEFGNRVLLNANDALHSAQRDVIEAYCRDLRRRLPRIDYLFCGFGGASYFPNCIHAPGKDDAAVAIAREEFFLRNFALIAERLKARHAFPFAAHFVLPDRRNWWISTSRLAMEPPAETVRRLTPRLGARVYDLQPGDWVEDDRVHASPYPRVAPNDVRRDVVRRYGEPPGEPSIEAERFDRLVAAVRAQVAQRVVETTAPLDGVFQLWDYPPAAIRVTVSNGHSTVSAISAAEVASSTPDVVFGTRSDLLTATMKSPFGRDLIAVGYAADVHLRSLAEVRSSAHERLLDLVAQPQPRWRQRFRRHPGRVLGFLVADASMRHRVKQKLLSRRRSTLPSKPRLESLPDWVDLAQTAERS